MPETGRQYHIGLTKEQGARYAILPGDPERVSKIAAYLDHASCVAQNREFTTYAGELSGERVLVTSTGIGGPSSAVALEELYRVGVKTAIRVGTCGGMQETVRPGDMVIASGAIRMEGTSKEYAPLEFPAIADFDVISSLRDAAVELGLRSHTGVVQSKDSFYGQHDPAAMPIKERLLDNWNAWIRCGCLASEMECAALFVAGCVRRMKLGAVLQVLWNQEEKSVDMERSVEMQAEQAVLTAVNAMRKLIEKAETLGQQA